MFYIITGIFLAVLGIWDGVCAKYFRHFLCGMCLGFIGIVMVLFGFFDMTNPTTTRYLEAEPFAYNQTQTVFTTDRGTYAADGLYPDGTYLLTVSGKDVLVVWQAVDGEVG